MKIKHFLLLAVTLVTLMTFGACDTEKGSKSEKIATGIVKLVKELDRATGDSTITDMSLSVIDNDAISDIQVVVPVDSGQRYAINVYVDDEKASNGFLETDSWVMIIAIVFIFGTPIFIAIIICMSIVKIKKNNNKVSIVALEKGIRLPDLNSATLSDKLQSGIKMVAWSAGLFLFFMVVGAESVAALAIIPLLIGAGRLLVYFIDKREIKQNPSDIVPPVPPVYSNKATIDNTESDAI